MGIADCTIRPAQPADAADIAACVDAAYRKYLDRMETKPAPMLADYGALIARGIVSVLVDSAGTIWGVLVMERQDSPDDALFIENVAVHPARQGQGLGKRLLAYAEQEAQRQRLHELRLYTNERMTENLAFYRALGFEETARRLDHGYRRVFLRKTVAGG